MRERGREGGHRRPLPLLKFPSNHCTAQITWKTLHSTEKHWKAVTTAARSHEKPLQCSAVHCTGKHWKTQHCKHDNSLHCSQITRKSTPLQGLVFAEKHRTSLHFIVSSHKIQPTTLYQKHCTYYTSSLYWSQITWKAINCPEKFCTTLKSTFHWTEKHPTISK